MSKKSYTDAQFDAFVAAHQHEHGAHTWPSVEDILRGLGGGKPTARAHLERLRNAVDRPIALSDSFRAAIEAAIAAEVRRAQDAIHADYADTHAELRGATEAAESALEAANLKIEEVTQDATDFVEALDEAESACSNLAERLDSVTAERDALRNERDAARTAAAVAEARLDERAEEMARLRSLVDRFERQATNPIQRAPAERQAETTPVAA